MPRMYIEGSGLASIVQIRPPLRGASINLLLPVDVAVGLRIPD